MPPYTASTMVAPRHLLTLLPAVILLAACGTPRDAVHIQSVARTAAPTAAARAVGDRVVLPSPVVPAPATIPALSATPPASPAPPAPGMTLGGDSDAALLAAIRAALGVDEAHVSVVVRRMRDGRGAALNADREYYAASLFKLALLYEAERQRSAGTLDFAREVQVLDEDVAEDLGTLFALETDAEGFIPVRAAVQAMITRSDNSSAVLMLRLLGAASVDRTLAGLGLRNTSVNTRDLPTTAADMALLMEMIVRGSGVDPAWREDMVGILLHQETRWGVPRLLPADVRVGNKTGTWETATHDVAFVDAPGGLYVIAVLCDRGWDWDPIARVSRAVYDEMAR